MIGIDLQADCGKNRCMSQGREILIFRFSSFGDVLQSLSLIGKIHQHWPDAKIHFCTRAEFAPLIENHPHLHRLWVLDKKTGLTGLLALGKQLKAHSWTHIYDCHNNLRTRILSGMLNGPLSLRRLWRGHQFIRRPLYRWKRFLLFKFHINRFPRPFSGQKALLSPLEQWGFDQSLPQVPQLFFNSAVIHSALGKFSSDLCETIALAPSAAYELKRWPLGHFKKLIQSLPQQKFVVLGGPDDTFAQELEDLAPDRVTNLAGQLSLLESSALLSHCRALVSNDTGLMHVAEQTGVPCVALMGPAPFGFPSRQRTTILELELSCRPCSKHGQGPCVNQQKFQQCMVDISPEQVLLALHEKGIC